MCSNRFHTSTNNRSFWLNYRHSLTLHVCTHKSTVSFVSTYKWNKAGRNRDKLFWRYIHIVNLACWNIYICRAMTANNMAVYKMSFTVKRLNSLSNIAVVFNISHFINDIVCNNSSFFINNSIRCFKEAIIIYSYISCKCI